MRHDELLTARRCDLSLPGDRLESRRSDREEVRILEMGFQHLGPVDPLSTVGQSGPRTLRGHQLSARGAPLAKAPRGLGATDIDMAAEDIARIFRSSRRRQASSAERYLSDAATSTAPPALPDAA